MELGFEDMTEFDDAGTTGASAADYSWINISRNLLLLLLLFFKWV